MTAERAHGSLTRSVVLVVMFTLGLISPTTTNTTPGFTGATNQTTHTAITETMDNLTYTESTNTSELTTNTTSEFTGTTGQTTNIEFTSITVQATTTEFAGITEETTNVETIVLGTIANEPVSDIGSTDISEPITLMESVSMAFSDTNADASSLATNVTTSVTSAPTSTILSTETTTILTTETIQSTTIIPTSESTQITTINPTTTIATQPATSASTTEEAVTETTKIIQTPATTETTEETTMTSTTTIISTTFATTVATTMNQATTPTSTGTTIVTTIATTTASQPITSTIPTTMSTATVSPVAVSTTTTTITTSPTTTTRAATATLLPFSATLHPRFGPVAGGTRVNITVNRDYIVAFINVTVSFNFVDNPDIHYSITTFYSTGEKQLTLLTEAINETHTGDWAVNFEVFGEMQQIPPRFSYRGNPGVQGIMPASQSIFGGTRMTVSGTNLNAVAFPVVHAPVKIFRPDPNNSSNIIITMAKDTPEVCSVNETVSSQMICPMPNMNLPQDFIDYLKNEASRSGSSRMRRFLADVFKTLRRQKRDDLILQTINGPSGSTAQVRLTFVFDSFDEYQNGTRGVDLDVNVPIQLPFVTDLSYFDPRKDSFLRIKGTGLTRIGSQQDYHVLIGVGNCSITSLTDNELTCRPPSTAPAKGVDDSILCPQSDSLGVLISFAGEVPYYYACLVYVYPNNNTSLIVGLTVGLCSLLVIIIIVIVGVIYRRQIKYGKNKSSQDDDSRPMTEICNVDSLGKETNKSDERSPTKRYSYNPEHPQPRLAHSKLTQDSILHESVEHDYAKSFDTIKSFDNHYETANIRGGDNNFSGRLELDHVQHIPSEYSDRYISIVDYDGDVPPADYDRDIPPADYDMEVLTADYDQDIPVADYDLNITPTYCGHCTPPVDYEQNGIDSRKLNLKESNYLQLV